MIYGTRGFGMSMCMGMRKAFKDNNIVLGYEKDINRQY
jgi:hypothetical protein